MVGDHFTSFKRMLLVTAGASFCFVPLGYGHQSGLGYYLVYAAALLFMAGPLMLAELALGRLGQASPVRALGHIQQEFGGLRLWRLAVWVVMVGALLLLSLYSVYAGEALYFTYYALTESLQSLGPSAVGALSNGFETTLMKAALWAGGFLAVPTILLSLRIRNGLDKVGPFLMGVMIFLLAAFVFYAAYAGDSASFTPSTVRFTLSANSLSSAIEAAFMTLGVGLGGMVLYGSYGHSGATVVGALSLSRMAAYGVGLNLVVVVAWAVAMNFLFPVMTEGGYSSWLFVDLPRLFSRLPYGDYGAALFYLLLALGAVMGAFVLMAPFVAWLCEAGLPRPLAALLTAAGVYALSIFTVLSLGPLSGYYPLDTLSWGQGVEWPDLSRMLVTKSLLPVGGLLLIGVAGWIVPRHRFHLAVGLRDGFLFSCLYALLRYVAPIGLLLILGITWL